MTERMKRPGGRADRAVRETDRHAGGTDGQDRGERVRNEQARDGRAWGGKADGRARDDGRLYWREMASPLGTLTLVASERGLCSVDFAAFAEAADQLAEWARRWWREPVLIPAPEGHPLLAEAQSQLDAYFRGELRNFSIPLDLRGTAFQRKVWKALCRVPYGSTASYGEIAAAVGRPGAARAVGGANNRNPVPIIVPCHRIIGADGSLVGYGGGLWIKERLLALEGILQIPSARSPAGKPDAAGA
ncbi:MAG TPA: methylated-DNA--[protein]-cysteine S-methyltransferase [Paenibacillaceae bacterium]